MNNILSPTHIEEFALNAWPGLQTYLFDGWVVRHAKGYTGRANSVTPLYDGQLPLGEKIVRVEQIFRRVKYPATFRLLSFRPESAELATLLRQHGYEISGKTITQTRPITQNFEETDETPIPISLDEFLAAYHRLQQIGHNAVHRQILAQAAGISRFILLKRGDQIVGLGLGVFDGQALGLFDIFTHPDHRRSGVAHTIINDLLRWGQIQGAKMSYLQVLATNRGARALYSKLGFTDLYSYEYGRLS